MEFFKKSAVRFSAAVISSVVAAVSAFIAVDALMDYRTVLNQGLSVSSLDFRYFIEREDADKLRMMADMYLENTDENGNIKGNEYFRKSLSEAMNKAGLTDKAGKPVLPEISDYYWQLSSEERIFSNNGEKTVENSEYLFEWKRGDFLKDWSESKSYTNGQGMYYYYDGANGYAVYDYDTSGLKSYTDDLGAVIYLNKDGTTPIPCIYNTSEYDSFDLDKPVSEDAMYTDSYYDDSIVLCLFPHEDDIAKYEEYLLNEELAESETVKNVAEALVLLTVSVIFMLYVVGMGGYDEAKGEFRLRYHDRIPGEIFLSLFIALPLTVFMYGYGVLYDIMDFSEQYILNSLAVRLGISFVLTFGYIVFSLSADSLLNRVKCHSVTDTFLILSVSKKICRKIRFMTSSMLSLRNDAFTIRFFIRLGLSVFSVIVSCFIAVFTREFIFLPFLAVIILIVYIYESLRDLKAISELGRHISEICRGNYAPLITDNSSVTYGMNEKLNSISDGIKTAVDEQLKSERMKIELVTNVSHDLKTPLTSIISYVDLLSKEELPPEAADYVAVLEQKTSRLKSIVSDVFDLAKATSHTDVSLEKIDAVILINQVIADMEDRVNEYGRGIKLDISAESAFINAEGKKMYRVLQNVFDNALKYSLSGTRIFVKLWCEEDSVHINVKNTASYEMTFTPEEIMERFSRGDKARTTEGSGLGLSIAKSFTEACGGKFDICIDGDLFSVNIEFEKI